MASPRHKELHRYQVEVWVQDSDYYLLSNDQPSEPNYVDRLKAYCALDAVKACMRALGLHFVHRAETVDLYPVPEDDQVFSKVHL